MSKNYKLEFFTPPNETGETEFYFGSLAAIYDTFTPGVVGCNVRNLWNVGVARGVEYQGAKCRIKSIEITHKQTNRGRAKK